MLIHLLFAASFIAGQTYKAEYNKLTAPLFDKDPAVICITEEASSLFDTLSQYPEFTKKYTCYSTEALSGLKDLLKVDVLDPENIKFIQAVKNKLAAGYILNWKSNRESGAPFILEIFSTATSSRIYTKKFFNSANSNPFNDAKRLLIDSMDVYYRLAYGELLITSEPDSVRFKLLKGDEVVLEWKRGLKQQTAAGTYRLIAEADNYITQEKEIQVYEGVVTSVNIELDPQFSKFIEVVPSDPKISNIKTDIGDEQVKISYDLAGTGKSVFDIEMTMKNKRTGNKRAVKMIHGDLVKVKPGGNKTILWQMLKELGNSPADEYEIKLSASEAGGVPWYYYAGGAALLGGVSLILGGGGGDNPSGSTIKAGTPPGRP